MRNILGGFEPQTYALLRIVSGFLFACHGFQKLFGVMGGTQVEYISQRGLAGVIETVGGLMIAAGAFTSPVAFIASGEMAVAYFQAHFPRAFWPIQNGGEPAALYCFLFLFFAARGDGIWSVTGRKR